MIFKILFETDESRYENDNDKRDRDGDYDSSLSSDYSSKGVWETLASWKKLLKD